MHDVYRPTVSTLSQFIVKILHEKGETALCIFEPFGDLGAMYTVHRLTGELMCGLPIICVN